MRFRPPICLECGKKPARALDGAGYLFCTLRCAARWATTAAPHGNVWCAACRNWSHPDDWKPEGSDESCCPMCPRPKP